MLLKLFFADDVDNIEESSDLCCERFLLTPNMMDETLQRPPGAGSRPFAVKKPTHDRWFFPGFFVAEFKRCSLV